MSNQTKAGTPLWAKNCCAVVVGVQRFSRKVRCVYVWRDGRMASPERIHRVTINTSVWDVAADVFGLSCPRVFTTHEEGLLLAQIYALRLMRNLASGVDLYRDLPDLPSLPQPRIEF